MARTALVKTTAPGFWSTIGAALTKAAGDVANGNYFEISGECLLIAWNNSASPYTITITSVADPTYGRSGNVTAQSLAADEIRIFRLVPNGWAQPNGQVYVDVSNAAITMGVIQL